MNVIAFTGKKRSGKDSAASMLVKHNPEYIPVSFAHPLKQMCQKYWGGAGITEDQREELRLFRIDFRNVVKGMKSLGFPDTMSYDFTERVIDVFIDHAVSIDERYMELSCTYRQILQLVGTDVCRHFKDDIWIEKAKESIDKTLALGKSVVITDLRFENEAHMLSEDYNAFIVEIRRDMCYNHTRLGNEDHKSEKGVPTQYVDFVIDNNGTLEDYECKLINLIGG